MAFKYSSVTKKVVMALAGLFLISFLIVHLSINLLLIFDDSRELFNIAAHFMGTNPVIQVFQIVLFGGILLHIIVGVILQIHNWMARPTRYKVEGYSHTSYFSKFMIHTGAVILAFLVIHLFNFFFKAKFGELSEMMINGDMYEDMGLLVVEKFREFPYVIMYIVWLLFLGFHLDHAFHSALQSLGLNHSKYTPAMFGISRALAILIAGGFILIPVILYINQ